MHVKLIAHLFAREYNRVFPAMVGRKEVHVLNKLQLSDDAPWKQRFRTPTAIW